MSDSVSGTAADAKPKLRTPADAKPKLVVVAWGGHTTRARDLALGFDGVDCMPEVSDPGSGRSPLVRWWLAGFATWRFLERVNPDAVIVQNPPIFAPLVAQMWARFRRRRIILDSHPGSFGSRQQIWSLFVPLHRVLARRTAAVMVPSEELASVVREWGGYPIVLHEAPPHELMTPASDNAQGTEVFVSSTGSDDEPLAALFDAARLQPDRRWTVSGDSEKVKRAAGGDPPANVELTGRLAFPEFAARMRASSVVLCMTNDSRSVSRSAWEATIVGRPVIVSDFPAARAAFPYAAAVANDAETIAAAVDAAISRSDEKQGEFVCARDMLLARWQQQREAVLSVVETRHHASGRG